MTKPRSTAPNGDRDQDPVWAHFERLAQHLTPPRRTVLWLLSATGPATEAELAAKWPPDATSGVVAAPKVSEQLVGQAVFRLLSLGHVAQRSDGSYVVTETGRAALAQADDSPR